MDVPSCMLPRQQTRDSSPHAGLPQSTHLCLVVDYPGSLICSTWFSSALRRSVPDWPPKEIVQTTYRDTYFFATDQASVHGTAQSPDEG